MYTNELTGHRGIIEFTVFDLDGSVIETRTIKNMITDVWFNYVRDAMLGLQNDLEIKYMAVGDSVVVPAKSDYKLGNERFRKPLTKKESQTSVGRMRSTTYLAPYEAVFQIGEIGFYGGNATDTKDSGVLLARVLYSRNKTSLESIQVVRTDEFRRV